jgi:hypothetical protein
MKLKEYLQIIADNKDDDFEVMIGNNKRKYITYKGLLDNYSDLTIYSAESKADKYGNVYHELTLKESKDDKQIAERVILPKDIFYYSKYWEEHRKNLIENIKNNMHNKETTQSKEGNTMQKYQVELKATVTATGLDELQKLTALADCQTQQLNETLEKINKTKISFDMEVK